MTRRGPHDRPRGGAASRGEGRAARPWHQSFPYTCGAAALGGVLVDLGWRPTGPRVEAELQLWRESTAVACPGAHPLGLALAARRRGFGAEVVLDGPSPWLWAHVSRRHPGFRRSEYRAVERVLRHDCRALGISVHGSSGPRLLRAGHGLVLSSEVDRSSGVGDPHWLRVAPREDGVQLEDPLWPTRVGRPQPWRGAWTRSGFEGTRCWVRIWRAELVPSPSGRRPPRSRRTRSPSTEFTGTKA